MSLKIDTKLMRSTIFLLALVTSACSHAQLDCQIDNPALQAMPKIEVTLTRDDGSRVIMPAKLADNNATRAAGFQRVCESTIEAMPILFVFKQPSVPSFHMNNVVAPIDIAFIDNDGDLESIQSMNPYSMLQVKKPLYSPKRPVLYALEVHKGFYQKHNISVDSKMKWTLPSANLSD
ncbi:MAG: uncharacterized membrane protein (UPF0127 family) [Arenicella sp.]|jgi:uncharacterized membrane protein (UPF0127 family)